MVGGKYLPFSTPSTGEKINYGISMIGTLLSSKKERSTDTCTPWMSLKSIMLSEKSHVQKATHV